MEPKQFLFSIDITDAGKEIYQQRLASSQLDLVFREAHEIIFEFLKVGVEELGGFRFQTTRPANEVRFKSMVLQHNILHGLDEEGVLWREEEVNNPQIHGTKKKVWSRVSMERWIPKT